MQHKKPQVLIIVQNLPVPFDRRVWQEATSLQRAGFGVAVVCPKSKTYARSVENIEGIDIYRYRQPWEADASALSYLMEWTYSWLASLVLAIRAYIRRPFQAIHACNPPDIFFALALLFRPLGVKFVFDHHDLCPEMYIAKGRKHGTLLHRGLLLLERLTMRSADRIIAVNQSHQEIAVTRGGAYPSGVVVVRSGPRSHWSEMRMVRPELKQGREHLVMYLGEMCRQDGVDHLLRAIQRYIEEYGSKDTKFVLVGGGPDRQRLQHLAEEMGLRDEVQFTGRISDEDLWAYLSTADVCVDPDPLTEWSNRSTMTKILEYAAFGRPIVAFDLLEHRRSAGDAAVYVAAHDHSAFAHAIRELLLDSERRLRMSQVGSQRFRDFLAWEHAEVELVSMYQRLLNCEPTRETPSAAEPGTVTSSATPAA